MGVGVGGYPGGYSGAALGLAGVREEENERPHVKRPWRGQEDNAKDYDSRHAILCWRESDRLFDPVWYGSVRVRVPVRVEGWVRITPNPR